MMSEIGKSLFAVVTLFAFMVFILFILSLVFVTAATGHIKKGSLDDPYVQTLSSRFGSLPSAVDSLFKAMSGGVEWEIVGDALMEVSFFYGFMFFAYILASVFCLLNLITAIFIECALDSSARSKIEESRAYTDEMKQLLNDIDQGGRGIITRSEFWAHLNGNFAGSEKLRDFFQTLELDQSEVRYIFELLDMAGDNKVKISQFSRVLLRLVGAARSVDVVKLQLENRRLARELYVFFSFVEGRFKHLSTALGVKSGAQRYAPL